MLHQEFHLQQISALNTPVNNFYKPYKNTLNQVGLNHLETGYFEYFYARLL